MINQCIVRCFNACPLGARQRSKDISYLSTISQNSKRAPFNSTGILGPL